MNVAVIGASGYTGLELLKLLHVHPIFHLHYVATTQGDTTIDAMHPALQGVIQGNVEHVDIQAITSRCHIVFLAVPHQTAMELVKALVPSGIKIIDLSADYRLELATYEKHYCPHTDKENLPLAVYGLPELYAKALTSAQLVANPGCYPTASILALAPFASLIEGPIFIDAKSGVSGAGKTCKENTHFVSIHENMFAYNPLGHRHAPEIAEKLSFLGTTNPTVYFVPHLVPITRGMLASCFITLKEPVDAKKMVEKFYAHAPFVRIRTNPVEMKHVSGTNFCDIYLKQEGNVVYIASAIDNLLRGASSQAVVNANIMCGLDQTLGIPTLAYVP